MTNTNTTLAKTQINSVQEIPFDVAWAEGPNLANVTRTETDGTTIFAGEHPEHGNIHIIIPAIGNGLLLFPFVIQDF